MKATSIWSASISALFALALANAARGETLVSIGTITSSAPGLRFGTIDTEESDDTTNLGTGTATALTFEADTLSTIQKPWLSFPAGARLRINGFALSGVASSLSRIRIEATLPVQSWTLWSGGEVGLFAVARHDQRQALGTNTELGVALFAGQVISKTSQIRLKLDALARTDDRAGFSGSRYVQALSFIHRPTETMAITAQFRGTQTRLDNSINNANALDFGIGLNRRFPLGAARATLLDVRLNYRKIERDNGKNQNQTLLEAALSLKGPARWTTKLTIGAQHRSAGPALRRGNEVAIGLSFERRL